MFSEMKISENMSCGQIDFLNNVVNDNCLKVSIHSACEFNEVEIVKILIDKNCDFEVADKNENNWFPIHYVCRNGNVRILQMLLDINCNIESLTRNKMRPIHFASRHGHYEIAQMLIDRNCNVNVFDQNKMYPIHYASRNGHFDVAKLLIDNKCNINVIDEDFFTPLHYACRRSHADIAELLIDANINIEAQDGDNWRPLHFACRYGELEIVKLLIDKKCDINARQANRLCAIHHACNHGYLDIVRLLIENGCDIEMCDKKFQRPIHFACANGDVKIVKLLIEHKCNIDSRTIEDKSPLKIAEELGNEELIDIVKEELSRRKQEKELINQYQVIDHMDQQIKQLISLMKLICEDNCNHKFCSTSLLYKKFAKGKEIGRGRYGKVYKIKDSGRNSAFAVKYISFDYSTNTKFTMENMNKLSKLNHARLVQYFGSIETEKHLCVFMEYASGGTIYDMILKRKQITERETIFYCKQILEGLEYLHEKNYIHRNVQPENILLDENNNVKLSNYDFGRFLTLTNGNSSRATTFYGTAGFIAPEILNDNPYTTAADIWSLGATIVNMLNGNQMFREIWTKSFRSKITVAISINFSFHNSISRSLNDLIHEMLKLEWSERTSASNLLKKEIFTFYDEWYFVDYEN